MYLILDKIDIRLRTWGQCLRRDLPKTDADSV